MTTILNVVTPPTADPGGAGRHDTLAHTLLRIRARIDVLLCGKPRLWRAVQDASPRLRGAAGRPSPHDRGRPCCATTASGRCTTPPPDATTRNRAAELIDGWSTGASRSAFLFPVRPVFYW